MQLVLFPALDMQIRQYNFEDMRKREYEIWTCVWRKTLSLDMRFVIYPIFLIVAVLY